MKQFTYVIKSKYGIHARPAGLLVNEVKKYKSSIKISVGENVASASKLFEILRLCIKQGDILTVTIDGEDEVEAATSIQNFLEKNL